jgi:dihydropyrimidinase
MTDRYDTVVSGGSVVVPAGVLPLDIAVSGEVIAAIGPHGAFDGESVDRVDARGCLVIPGGVDPHVHFKLRVPSVAGETIPDEGQEYSYAAAFGGTTTIIDFALWERERWDHDPAHDLARAVTDKKEEAAGKMAVDYSFHLLLIGNPSFEALDEIGGVIEQGIPTIKTSSACPPWTSDDGHRLGVMLEVAEHGGLHILHAEDQAIMDWLTAKYERDGKIHGAYTSQTRGALVEEAAIRRAILLSERTGCPLYVLHVGAGSGAEAIREARGRGASVFGETLICYLSFTSAELWDDARRGLLWNNWPVIKEEADRAELWRAIADGTLQVVSSDHWVVQADDRYAYMGETIEGGGQAGQAAVEMRVPVLFSMGVSEGRLSVERFVDLVATNPAKLMGLYPRKGVIREGSDADLVVIDPNKTWTVTAEEHHMSADYNCWEGWTLRGAIKTTILRGAPLVVNGEWVGDRAGGRFLERSVDPAQLSEHGVPRDSAAEDAGATAAAAAAGMPGS